jgi:tRNA(Ile2)-agmatinylcytidine synthase
VIRRVQGEGADVIGLPRLVRLNPNVPWKTRGNAALGVRLGVGRGASRPVGLFPEGPVRAYDRARPLPPGIRRRIVEAAWEAVLRNSESAARTDPALVATERPLSAALYWAAVHRVVAVDEVKRVLEAAGAEARTRGSEQGLVGAAAAVAWPARRSTFELIAYREPARFDRPRQVDRASVRAAARRHPELFLCEDPRTRRVMVTPHTPCPVLFGLRASDQPVLPVALAEVRSEPVERWLLFRTNQGTGDHRKRTFAADLEPYGAGSVAGRVIVAGATGRGGHARFAIEDARRTRLDCVAFEPTKTLPRIVTRLVPGDRVRVWGGRAADPTFRVEGIEITALAPRWVRRSLRRCPACGGRLGSVGRDEGYRCRSCRWKDRRMRMPTRSVPPGIQLGVFHPTPSARRHLAPLPTTDRAALGALPGAT